MNNKLIKQLQFVSNELMRPHALAGLNSLVSENETKEFKKIYGISIKEAQEGIELVARHLVNTVESLKK